ncbi:MAG TPA: hypothetical protein VFZ40_05190 [Pyrinomonadaceae bacterium]
MELPPLIRLAIDEELWKAQSVRELKHDLTKGGLQEELQAQAEWTNENFAYVDQKERFGDSQYRVSPSGTLNPFTKAIKCFGESCTHRATDDFIKSVGLYSEAAILPDPLTGLFAFESFSNDHIYEDLLRKLRVLRKVVPLIESGVLTFGTPTLRYCENHMREFDERMKETSQELIAASHPSDVEVVHKETGETLLFFRLPLLQPDHDHPLNAFIQITKSEGALIRGTLSHQRKKSAEGRRVLREVMARKLRSDLSSLFTELAMSRRLGSLLLAGSRAEVLMLTTLDKKGPDLREIEDWERARTIHLPWIGDLTAEEVLTLRKEASKALPRLRELLRERITKPTAKEAQMTDTVADLRSQALEVQSELDALKLPKERKYRTGMAGLTMAFVIYGFATQSPPIIATSVAGLLATLVHLRNAEREQDNQLTKQTSMPGYALLKAREIISGRQRG